jgi:endonuclease YncB( thermonuclease family)
MSRKVLAPLVVTTIFLCAVSFAYAFSGEIDGTAVATTVHDGDTFNIDTEFHISHTVRLADVDASELGQHLSYEAIDYLIQLVRGKSVYLDIDDVYIYDYYGTGDRLVCVVYVDYNSTHYMNVNEALVVAGLAEVKDYDNEFNVGSWTLYVKKTDVAPEFPSFLVLPLFLAATILLTLLKRRAIQRT